MNRTAVYSIVGYSGAGKTTLVEKLIPELKQRGLRVCAFKHDAHDFDIDHEGKDSWRMSRAGADVTIVASETKAAVIENRAVSAEELLSRIKDVDVIITEGYKHGKWKKIAILREASVRPIFVRLEECFAVMTDARIDTDRPCLALEDASGLAELIENDMNRLEKCS